MFAIMMAVGTAAAPMTPMGPWQVVSGDVGCSAIRSYGPIPRAAVAIQRDIHNSGTTIAVEAAAASLPKERGQTELRLSPSRAIIKVGYGTFAASDNGNAIVKLFPDAVDFSELASAKEMQVGKKSAVFALSSVAYAKQAVENCNRDLLQSWGADPDLYTQDRLAVPLDAGRWFSEKSYPTEAKARHIAGRVVLLIQSRSDGNLESCKVVVAADPTLDEATCAIVMQKVKVLPPVDEKGQPIPSYAILPVRWGN